LPQQLPVEATAAGAVLLIDAPQIGAGFQVLPVELTVGQRLELEVQGARIVVVDQLHGLANFQCIEHAEDFRVTQARLDLADVDGAGKFGVHGGTPETWATGPAAVPALWC